ncbi:MAG: GAF domain-containing protein [Cytophagales bacterium]|nr:GAF domain-containing protein [Cytophaga sp.]
MDINEVGQFDAEVCENIPLHNTNKIQAYGFLIVTDNNFTIIQISDNVPELFEQPQSDFLLHNLNTFIQKEQYEELITKVDHKNIQDNIPLTLEFSIAEKTLYFNALIHLKKEYIIIELEKTKEHSFRNFTSLYQEIRYISALLKGSTDLDELCQLAAVNLKNISGFDRIMIYKFDDEWNGKVLGEAKEEYMDSYMHLHFPSSDIPKQARQLYLKNAYRLIPDIKYKPSFLIPEVNSVVNGITDLSECNLRSVAEVHLEYLNNMDVQASMSVPIIKDQQLWGIVACHNKKPKKVSYEVRSTFELLSSILSEQITSKETRNILEKRIRLSASFETLLEQMSSSQDFIGGLTGDHVNFLELLNITGAAIIYENNYNAIGDVPDQAFVTMLMEWHHLNLSGRIYYTNNLPGAYEQAIPYAELASGVIFLPLSLDRKYYIIGFRKEYVRTIAWAGNPGHDKGLSGDIHALHPRNSFSVFHDQFRFHSEKWDAVEIEMAENLLKAVLEIILKSQIIRRVIAEEESYQLSFVAQKTSNAVFTLDKNGNVEWVNEAFLQLSGKPAHSLIGKKLEEVLESANGFKDISDWMHELTEHKSFKRDIIINKEDKDVHMNFDFAMVEGENHSIEKVIAIGTDFTTIKEKTTSLEALNRQLDEYAYIVSHDLKAPLKGIEGLLGLLSYELEDKLTDHNRKIMMLINESLLRMNNFIANILRKARVGSKIEEVNLNKMFVELLEWMSVSKEGITFSIQQDLPMIITDKISLMQVFGNLLSNAVKYGVHESRAAVIETGISSVTESFVEFFVKDNGNGVPEKYQQKIFELFNTGQEIDSTGIGLSTAKSLVEENGGKIWLNSIEGEGAAFYFTWKISSL